MASDALVNKGTVAGAAAAATNFNGGRISMNNNNDSSIHDKNATSKPFGLGGGGDGGDAFNAGKANGDGTGNGTAAQNNGQNLDNFADFDALASVTQKDFDPFASADAFADPIGFNSTQIDGAAAGTKTVGAISNKSASAAAKDRFFSDSLSNATTPTKPRSTITATALTTDSNGGTNGRRNSQTKGVSINDYFDAKFDSFMTTTTATTTATAKTAPKDDSAADLANANSNKTKASPFGLDDNEFADFNNANIFKAAFDTTDHAPTNSMSSTQFDLAFQPSPNSTIKSTKSTSSALTSAFLPLPPPAGKSKQKSATKSNTSLSAAAVATAFDCDNKKSAEVTTALAAKSGATVTTGEPEKVSTKFRNDYSKTDQFEDDLQEVLKRSLVDQ